MKKKILTAITVMVLSMLCAVSASAASSGTCGDNVTWILNDSGVLTISGTGDMTDYQYSSSSSTRPSEWSNATSLVIEDGIAGIGNYAFRDCTGLTSITISDSVTSIGNQAFYGCTGLTSITIPDNVTSIGYSAFYGCSGMRSITIPDSVTSIDYSAFYGCSNLKNVYISDITAWYNIEFINAASTPMYYADNLYLNRELVTSVAIPDGVTSIGDYVFYGCGCLTSITIPDSVTSIGTRAFDNTGYYNNSDNWNGKSLYIGNYLISVDNSVKGVYGVKEGIKAIAGMAFSGCTGLTSITIPDSVASIGDYVFYGCDSLTSITIPDSVTSIGDCMFYGCGSLTSITIPDSVTSIGNSVFRGCTGLTNITVPDNVTSIGDYVFYGCDSLTSITIPDGVTSIGYSAFRGCTGLTNITIPDSVTSIDIYAFYDTGYYNDSDNWENKVLYIGNHLIDAKTTITGTYEIKKETKSISDSAFSGCTGLTSITIPDGITSISHYAFSGCTGLTSITIPDSVTSIGHYAFRDCTALTDVHYGGTVNEWNSISIGTDNTALDDATIHSVLITVTYTINYNYNGKTLFSDSGENYVGAIVYAEKGFKLNSVQYVPLDTSATSMVLTKGENVLNVEMGKVVNYTINYTFEDKVISTTTATGTTGDVITTDTTTLTVDGSTYYVIDGAVTSMTLVDGNNVLNIPTEKGVDYEVRYQLDGVTKKTISGSGITGDTVTADLTSVTVSGITYCVADDATTSMVLTDSDNILNVKLRNAYSYTVTVNASGAIEKQLSSHTVVENNTLTYYYPKYISDGSTLYVAKALDGMYRAEITPTENIDIEIKYSEVDKKNVAYFTEGEDISGATVVSSDLCSNGKGGYRNATVTTLPAGKYIITAGVAGTSGTVKITTGDSVLSVTANGTLREVNGDELVLTEETDVVISGSSSYGYIDYIIIEKTGTANYVDESKEITAGVSNAQTKYYSDTNKATGFSAELTNTGTSFNLIQNVTWEITPSNDKSVEIPVELDTIITLKSGASAIIGIVLDGLYDTGAEAAVKIG